MTLARLAHLLLAATLLAFSSQAQEDLYGPAAPLNVAYLRVVHAAPDDGPFAAASGDLLFAEVMFTEVTPYYPLEPGTVELSAGDVATTLELAAGSFYTAVFMGGQLVALEDEPLVDASRGLLTLYNFSRAGPLELKTADGETEVIAGVEPGGSGSIVINEAEVALGVFAGETSVGALEPRLLGRGVAHAVMVFDGPGGPIVTYAPAELAQD